MTKQEPPAYSELYGAILIGPNPQELNTSSMALMDSGNLLQYPVMSKKLHQQLGLKLLPSKLQAKTANKQALTILGLSTTAHLRFAGSQHLFSIQPLVIEDLSSHLNLGAKFNFNNEVNPQVVRQVGNNKQAYW